MLVLISLILIPLITAQKASNGSVFPQTPSPAVQLAQEQAAESGKSADIQAKMVAGKLNKFKAERALLKQPFVKDPTKTIEDLINETVQEIGENITVSEFTRHII